MQKPTQDPVRQNNWLVLLDPNWRAPEPDAQPPVEVIAGGWMLDENGRTGPFQPNPKYVPGDATTPSDPTDAVLRMIADGEPLGEQLIATIRDSIVFIACDAHNAPLVDTSPDGVPCVLIATAEIHKRRVSADYWWPVQGTTLSDIAPPGTDILLNPGSSTQFRMIAAASR